MQEENGRKRRRQSIRWKMFGSMFVLILFLMILINAIVYHRYTHDIEKTVLDYSGDTVQKISENLTDTILALEENMMYKISSSELFDYQENPENVARFSVEQHMHTFAELMKSQDFAVDRVYVLDRYENFFCWDQRGKTSENRTSNVVQYIEENYDTLKSLRGKTIWRRFADEPDHIYLIKSVLDQDTLKYEGVLCLAADRKFLDAIQENLSFFMVLYDENGELLYLPEGLTDDIDKMQKRPTKQEGVWKNYLVTESKVRKKGWMVEGAISRKMLRSGLGKMTKQIFLLELVFLALSTLLTAWLSKNMTINITALIRSFRSIGSGMMAEDIVYKEGDETAYLCEKFNEMNHRLQSSVEQMAVDRTQKEKAEYNAIIAQMNPHFLYNTLESINALAKLEGQEKISGAITELAGLLRASLPGAIQEIPLRDELQYAGQYLSLQKLIKGDFLEWDITADPDVLDCKVPKLILQPLLENAMKHGFAKSLDVAMLVIVAKEENGKLLLDLCDNGAGMEKEVLQSILEEKKLQGQDREHIGIQSIQRRIRYLYGAGYGLTVQSTPGEGTVVSLSLPQNRKSQEETNV